MSQKLEEREQWTFERSWRHAEAVYPALVRDSTSGNSPELASHQSYLRVEARAQKLIYESGGTLPMGKAMNRARGDVVKVSLEMQDPRIAQEIGKHEKLDDSRKSDAIDGHVDRW
jgi:hypothetical protein